MAHRDRIGLALGGGAARGISHIGVLSVLEQKGVKIDVVAGTSMGAIVGALYLLEGSAEKLIDRMYALFQSAAFSEANFDQLRERRAEEDLTWIGSMTGLIRRGYKYSLSVTRQSIIKHETFKAIIEEMVPDISIEDLPRPFAAVSLDVVAGEEIVWTKGSLRDALWASSAIPGFFPPLEIDGMILVDGAWTNAVPVKPALDLGADKVIAVDISREVEELVKFKRGISLILRSAIIASKRLREVQIQNADLVIRPDVGDVHWADFSNPERIMQKGKDAAYVSLDFISEIVRPPSRVEDIVRGFGEGLRKKVETGLTKALTRPASPAKGPEKSQKKPSLLDSETVGD